MVMLRRQGQSVLELVIALIGTMVFFVGMLRVWAWLVTTIVARQRNFDATRVTAGTPEPGKAGSLQNLAPPKIKVWEK